MAEKKPEKKPQAAPAAAAAPAGGSAPAPASRPQASEAPAAAKGGGSKLPIVIGGVMIVEALVLCLGFRIMGAGTPHAAQGANLTSESSEGGATDKAAHGAVKGDKKTVELSIIEFKAPNNQRGRLFIYDVSIQAVAKNEYEEKVKQAVKDRDAMIKDRIRTIIAQSDPEKLGGGSEPGLETLRRQVKYQLDEIVGEGMIDEVLISRCIPYRADY
jgi:flagellar basal body-associated protein FliL